MMYRLRPEVYYDRELLAFNINPLGAGAWYSPQGRALIFALQWAWELSGVKAAFATYLCDYLMSPRHAKAIDTSIMEINGIGVRCYEFLQQYEPPTDKEFYGLVDTLYPLCLERATKNFIRLGKDIGRTTE